jgi:indole-3-glycerol phosphate synthase
LNFLNQILDVKKEEVKKLKNKYSLSSFTDMEFFDNKPMSFIEKVNGNKANSLSIITEIKKASPSKGIIKNDFNHLKIAEVYLKNNVDAISILTDEKFFQGNISYLSDIARISKLIAMRKEVPLLRKDFIIDEIQLFEAKAHGADLILLICEALSKNQIHELSSAAKELGLEILLELHSENQINKIDSNMNKIIGVNNRNLEDFEVSLETTKKISEKLTEEIILVSESGISKKEDIDFLKHTSTNAILVGEHLMRSSDISESIKQLKEWCNIESESLRNN